MALKMNTFSFLRHIFISAAAPTTPFLSLFSTLNTPLLQSPFAHFAKTTVHLSSAEIARILKRVPYLNNPKTLQNVERVVHLLTQYGCTAHDIARIMKIQPTILSINAEKLLQPKIELLKDLGFDEKDVAKLLIRVPLFLSRSLQDYLLPNITFLKNLFQPQKLLLKAVKLNPYIFTYNLEKNLRPSLAFWEGCGLQREELVSFLSSKPGLLRSPSLTPPKVDLIRNIGIVKENKMYKNVLSVVAPARMETLESKIDNFRQWGLSFEEIWELFRTYPSVFNLSEDTVRKKMEFVVSTLELPPNYVVNHSAFLRYSLEKVIKPRFVVFQHSKSKSLNGIEFLKSMQLFTIISMSEANFVNKILKGRPELEKLYALHRKA